MALRRWDGSAFQDAGQLRRWDGSQWVDAGFGRRWDGSQWVDFWPTYVNISASLSPTGYNNTVSNNTGPYSVGFTCNVTGGDSTETYTWSVTNTQGSAWSITSGQGTSAVTVQVTDGVDSEFLATLQCVVDDGISSDTASGSLAIVYGVPD